MVWMRCLKDFDYADSRGEFARYTPGKLVDVINTNDVARLKSSGFVCEPTYSHTTTGFSGVPAPKKWVGTRVGFFIFTSQHYSGGRIHMFQYAWCLAELGAEVYMFTNRLPRWRFDYPESTRIHYVTDRHNMPADCDIIITDSKTEYGRFALEYKRCHPHNVLIGFNFETPNWVAEFVPDYANALDKQQTRQVFNACDVLFANSAESAKHLLKWLNKPATTYCGILPPAVNTFALDAAEQSTCELPERPYAVFSARAATYKRGRLVQDAIWALDIPFDLVVFGHLPSKAENTELHTVHLMSDQSDADKFRMMANARVVCAPSLFEGFGMVPGEAISAGTPVLVYDLPVLRQEYGDRLIYVKWKDEAAYTKELQTICKAKKKIRVGKTHRENYGMQAMLEKITTLKYNCIGKRKAFAHMIAYWGVIPEAIESVYPYVDEILIAYGRDKYAIEINDGSLLRIQSFPDPDDKIKLECREQWFDKRDMRQWCVDNSSGNYHILLDGDEIWVGLDKWLERNHPYSCPAWVNFWHGKEHWVYDDGTNANRRWGARLEPFGSVCHHYRSSYWRRSYYFQKHPAPVDFSGNSVNVINSEIQQEALPGSWIAHLGHSLPREVMEAKHKFYRSRDGDDAGRKRRQEAWHNWAGKTGDVGDGVVAKVDWELPDIVQRGFASLEAIKL